MKSYIFEHKVQLDDLDYMRIVGNAQWLIFLERARIQLLEEVKFPLSKLMQQKIGGVVSEANIKYLKPAFFGDILRINITPQDPFAKGLYLTYEITDVNSEIYLQAKIKIIFVNELGKPIKMPEELANALFSNHSDFPS